MICGRGGERLSHKDADNHFLFRGEISHGHLTQTHSDPPDKKI